MTLSRPRIGVTGPDKGGLAAWLFTRHAVKRAGGKPLRIRPGKPRLIDEVDGLIIGGGADVSPTLYGQESMPKIEQLQDRGMSGWRRLAGIVMFPLLAMLRRVLTTKTTGLNEARDELEKHLIRQALERDLPVFGICRGMQLINVVAGGTLHQNIESFYEEYPVIRSVLPRKQVCIEPDSLLAQALGRTAAQVNALHDQAIDRLGKDMKVCAREPSGVIQAVEHGRHHFLLGVQWHPEYLPQRPEQRALFRAVIDAAEVIRK